MKLDVMPTDERILGFSNRWYKSALKSARTVVFEGLNLRVVTAPYFVATKLEAFKGRGADDVYASKDLEDVISVVDGRPSLLEEISGADTRVRSYIGREFDELMKNRGFLDALPGHVPGDPASQSRVPRIMRAMRALARIAPVRGTKLVAKRGTGRPRRQ
jgi:hypothetical protein